MACVATLLGYRMNYLDDQNDICDLECFAHGGEHVVPLPSSAANLNHNVDGSHSRGNDTDTTLQDKRPTDGTYTYLRTLKFDFTDL